MRHPENVRVDGQRRLAEGDIEHDIGGLAADPGQRLQRLAVVRHLAAVLGDQRLRQRDHVLGLVAVEADGLDVLAARSSSPSASIFCGVSATLNSAARRLVDAGVGRLRRQHHGHQQREGIDVLQLALGLGIGRGKPAEDLGSIRSGATLALRRARAWAGRGGPRSDGSWASGLRAGRSTLIGLQS